MQSEGVAPTIERARPRLTATMAWQPLRWPMWSSVIDTDRVRGMTAHVVHASRGLHVRYRIANLLAALLPGFAGGPVRSRLYRWAGFRGIARSVVVAGNLNLVGASMYDKLFVGEGAMIAYDVTISLDGEVHIGDSVSIGPSVKIYTGTHTLGPASNRRHHKLISMPVTVGAGCWLGVGAIILPGVTVGRGSVVSAGAVVTEDVPPNSYVAGNPARVVRSLPWGNR